MKKKKKLNSVIHGVGVKLCMFLISGALSREDDGDWLFVV